MTKKSNPFFPELDFNLSRKGRGKYNKSKVEFIRGDEPFKGSEAQLRLRSRKSGDLVVAKLYSDIDGDGRFSKDELIFKGSAAGDDIYSRLKVSSGKIRWDHVDCTPCLREPFNFLTLNPTGFAKVEFFSIGAIGMQNDGVAIGEPIEIT